MFKGLFKKAPVVVRLTAPVSGAIVPLGQLPDPAFQFLGKGVAIQPTEGRITAPAAGTISAIFPTKHAVGLTTPEGLDILIHIGINTVELNGEGFTCLVQAGDRVSVGQVLVEFSLELVQDRATSAVTPVIITNPELCKALTLCTEPEAKSGSTVLLEAEI
ncbi:PTS sugar transporter subunit IIA [Propionispora hippei]|uniref:PTS system, glucose-specific IIA component n=1 Tax=Propionispora hippei DSM 15287 TaxID=1123003 RepID=A0A1M6G7H5_9FIRM|nr:PTS glucose transporter subunit IIA [Propionispora hippei]SHJ05862.1 PTS system, glucose-specific IIA component [Propionispora hippei DSM 15287]